MNRKYYLDEYWKDLKGYEGLYQISNYGRVRSLNYRGSHQTTILHITAFMGNYLKVGLRKNGEVKYYRVHRLVAINFLPPPLPEQTHAEHINGNRQDNRVCNIRWTTPKGNMANEITRIRISLALMNPSPEKRQRISEGQKRRFARERATHTGRYAFMQQ